MRLLKTGQVKIPLILVLLVSAFVQSDCSQSRTPAPSSLSSSENASTFPQPLKDVAFGKVDRAWGVTGRGNLFCTLDGGRNWGRQSGEFLGGFDLISFVNGEQGWAVNHTGDVWATKEPFTDWSKISTIPYEAAKPMGGGIFQFSFSDAESGWAKDLSSLWTSSDGGHSWTHHPIASDTVLQNALLDTCRFHGKLSAWVFTRNIHGEASAMFSTSDGATSWTESQVPQHLDTSTVFRLNDNIAWAQIGLGTICRTTDSGRHWDALHSVGQNQRILSLFFLNETEGWLTCTRLTGGGVTENKETDGTLFHTIDGGKTWQVITSLRCNRYLNRVYFTDDSHGWMTSFDQVFYTADAAQTWKCVLTIPEDEY